MAQKWTWGSRIEAAVGGSDGTYEGDTGITWMFAKQWAARAGFNFTAIDFENGAKGDDDWYLYDVDEYGATLSLTFNW